MSSSLRTCSKPTGLGEPGAAMYERAPQFRTGIQFARRGLQNSARIQPSSFPVAASSALTTDQRLREGDIAGPESNQPGLESRVVLQFPLNKELEGRGACRSSSSAATTLA